MLARAAQLLADMTKNWLLAVLLCCTAHTIAQAQAQDTLPPGKSLPPIAVPFDTIVPVLDSAAVLAVDFLRGDSSVAIQQAKKVSVYPDPKTAVLWAMLPGAGQIYNKKWWKVPIVYGAFGTGAYFIVRNTVQYRDFKTALEAQREGEVHQFSAFLEGRPNPLGILRTERDQADKRMQQSYIATVLIYLLQGVDAFVDAHLAHFDIGDDLTLGIKPGLYQAPTFGAPAPGLGLHLGFGDPKRKDTKSPAFAF